MIRPARPADRPAIRAIQRASLAEPWPDLIGPAIEGPPLALVATADGAGAEPVAYAIAIPTGEDAYLAEIAVAEGHRGAGLGSDLLTDLRDRLAADGFEGVALTVREADERARSFYERQGFEVVDRLPDAYEDGAGLRLRRPL